MATSRKLLKQKSHFKGKAKIQANYEKATFQRESKIHVVFNEIVYLPLMFYGKPRASLL